MSALSRLDELLSCVVDVDDEKEQHPLSASKKKKNVLFLFPLARDYAALDTLPVSVRERYNFTFMDSEHFSYSSRASKEFSLVDFIAQCVAKVRTESIEIVISTRDIADLVHSILAHVFEHISGPKNYMSSFMTIYKPYTRLFIDLDDPINFEVINMSSPQWQNPTKNMDAIKAILHKLNGKGFMKPPSASCSSLVGDFTNCQEFIDLLKMHSQHGHIFSHYLSGFVSKYMTSPKMQSLLPSGLCSKLYSSDEIANMLLLEEFMDTPVKITVDGCVVNKKIFVWGIVDSIYWSHIDRKECFVGCFMPSNLSRNLCDVLIAKYSRIVQRLIDDFGFDNQFIDVEFFVRPHNSEDSKKCTENVANWGLLKVGEVDLKLMEINGRGFMQMTPVYRHVFKGFEGDIIGNLLKIYDPDYDNAHFAAPAPKKGVCALNGYLPTFASGLAEDLFDFEAAQKYVKQGVVILAVSKGQKIETVSQQGTLLAYANIAGKSYQECFQKMVQIGKELVKKDAPWDL